jgi:hypothetical protein
VQQSRIREVEDALEHQKRNSAWVAAPAAAVPLLLLLIN